MTKKDFDLSAASLLRSKPISIASERMDAVRMSVYATVVGNMADSLRATNPNFDRRRFVEACGLANIPFGE